VSGEPPEWRPEVPQPGPPPEEPPPQPPVEAEAEPPPDAPTSRLAIAAFVLGLVGLILPAVICAVIALGRIKERRLKGRGLAIAGLSLSGIWAVVIAALVIAAVTDTGPERDERGQIRHERSVSVFDIRPGDCLEDVDQTDEAFRVDALPCDRRHGAEVFASFQVGQDEWPGVEAIAAEAEERCNELLRSRSPRAFRDPRVELFFFHPTETSWERQDDREVLCVVTLGRRAPGGSSADPPGRSSLGRQGRSRGQPWIRSAQRWAPRRAPGGRASRAPLTSPRRSGPRS
jgi:hypothetical protein